MENDIRLKKYIDVEKMLLSEYEDLIKSKPVYSKVDDKDFKIFFSWWQGKSKMPYVVQRCYENLKKRTKHEVCFVDKYNYDKYVDLPSYVIDKLNKGTLIQPNFSDVLRFSLLKKYSGLWTDGTIFYTDDLENHSEIFNSSLWSIRNYDPTSTGASQGRWQGGCHSTNLVNNPFHSIGAEIIIRYLKDHDEFPIYFFADCVMSVLYWNNDFCRKIFDAIPEANHWPAFFRINMNEVYNSEEYNRRIKSGFIHILSWKKAIDYNKDSYIRQFFKDFDNVAYEEIQNKCGLIDILHTTDIQYKNIQRKIVEQLPVYRLMASWMSILCYDDEGKLFHSSVNENYVICRYYDGNIAFFVPKKMQYISSITKEGKFSLSNDIVFFKVTLCSEVDMLISISVGASFLSACRGGNIELAPAIKAWEKFNLIY